MIHSLLAANQVKDYFQFKYYRLFYNLISILGLIPLILIYREHAQQLWLPTLISSSLAILILMYGSSIILVTFRYYDTGLFMGWDLANRQEALQLEGLHQFVRHPLYYGSLWALWGGLLLFRTDLAFVYAGIGTAYLIIGSRLEEKKLIDMYGEEYQKYLRHTPALIPKKFGAFHRTFFANLFRKKEH